MPGGRDDFGRGCGTLGEGTSIGRTDMNPAPLQEDEAMGRVFVEGLVTNNAEVK